MSQKKQQAWKFGRFAEGLAAWHLRFRGYRIVARGFRSTVGEIDIVARRGRILVFVEVKARGNLDAGTTAKGPGRQDDNANNANDAAVI